MNLPRAIFCIGLALGLASGAAARAAGGEFMEYQITWVGISVGTMTIRSETIASGHLLRSVRLWNRPWLALLYPVDTTVECEIVQTPDGPCHTVRKKVKEKKFRQDDTMVLWPDQGRVVWSNTLRRTVQSASVPQGSRDLVSFIFDLRDVLASGPLQAGGNYQLVMDGGIHELEIKMGQPQTVRTPFGRMDAVLVDAQSKSKDLFSRNRPESVWVATSRPAVLFADVESRFGPVRATLVKWEIGGQPVEWKASEPKAD